eukprot:gene4065-5089_t
MHIKLSEEKCSEHELLVSTYCCSCEKYFCPACDKIIHSGIQIKDDDLHLRVLVNEDYYKKNPVTIITKTVPSTQPQTTVNNNNQNQNQQNNINNNNNNNNSLKNHEEIESDNDGNAITFNNTVEIREKSNSCGLEEGEEDEPYEEQEKEAPHIVQGLIEGAVSLGFGIANGVTGVVTDPIEGASSGGGIGLVKGVAKGIGGIAIHPMRGVGMLLTRTAEGFRNTPDTIFTDSNVLVEPIKDKEAAHLLDGLYQGTLSLSKGILDGVTGIVIEPMKGVEQEGAKGFFKGVGKGLMGVVVKPISGAIDFVGKPIEGLANTPKSIVEAIENKNQLE